MTFLEEPKGSSISRAVSKLVPDRNRFTGVLFIQTLVLFKEALIPFEVMHVFPEAVLDGSEQGLVRKKETFDRKKEALDRQKQVLVPIKEVLDRNKQMPVYFKHA